MDMVWSPPPGGFIKINTDAAYDLSFKVASLGIVTRMIRGLFGCVLIHRWTIFKSPLQAELLAICFGLRLPRSYNFISVLIESDSLLAVNEIFKQSILKFL